MKTLLGEGLTEQAAGTAGRNRDSVTMGRSRILLLFSAAALLLCFLHVQAEHNVRGSIPPDSDSVVYQNGALNDLYLWQKGKLSYYEFCFGSTSPHFVPPLHKWSLEAGYLMLGINNFSPYVISGLWLVLAGLALFLLVRHVTGSELLALTFSLLLFGLPAALTYGFMSSQNDWAVTALCLMGFYGLITSEIFRNRARALVGGSFWGLALMVKSSVLGYLFLPIVVLAVAAIVKRRHIARAQVVNAMLAGLVAILLSGWFYAHSYREVSEYYAFWSSTNLANVLNQYQLHTVFDERVFYLRNSWLQLGPVATVIMLAGLALLAGFWRTMRHHLSATSQCAVAWGVCFAFLPYILLIYRRGFASIADINMIPFLIFLCVIGWWWLLNAVGYGKPIIVMLLSVVVLLNLSSVLRHNQARLYQGIDADKAARSVVGLLKQNDYRRFRPWSLNQDIYFNQDTLLHVLYRNPIDREHFDFSIPDLSLDAKFSPLLTPEARYAALAEGSSVLLVSDRPKGFPWMTINQQWKPLRNLVQTDRRFSLLGKIQEYDDKTSIEVYAKEALFVEGDADGWMVNDATLSVFAQPGVHHFTIKGASIGQSVTDLSLVGEDGKTISGVSIDGEGSRQFMFEVSPVVFSSRFRLRSNSPAVPSKLASSSDQRELLLRSPYLSFVRQ